MPALERCRDTGGLGDTPTHAMALSGCGELNNETFTLSRNKSSSGLTVFCILIRLFYFTFCCHICLRKRQNKIHTKPTNQISNFPLFLSKLIDAFENLLNHKRHS